MNGQGDQGTLKMNAVHMYCAAAKKILRAARAKLQNLGSNLGCHKAHFGEVTPMSDAEKGFLFLQK